MTPDHAEFAPHAEFAQWDAAYVLGALTPADRARYERHLDDCDRCRSAVAELVTLPGLLAAARPVVDAGDGTPGAEPPPGLVRAVTEREGRRRRRIRARIAVGLAAAAVAATAVVIAVSLLTPAAPAATISLAAVSDTRMTATVALVPVAWGTRIEMECAYPSAYGSGETGPWSYTLVVTDVSGESSQVSTWNAVPGARLRFEAATALALEDIATIEVTTADGESLLVGRIE